MAWTISLREHRVVGNAGNKSDKIVFDAIWDATGPDRLVFAGQRLLLPPQPVPRQKALERIRDELNDNKDAALNAKPADPTAEIVAGGESQKNF